MKSLVEFGRHSLSKLDSRYVKVTGDTMTGTLNINVPTASSEAIILKTTDDDTTNNLFEIQGSSSNVFVGINPKGQLTLTSQYDEPTLGSELLSDWDFSSDPSGVWTYGGSWTWDSGNERMDLASGTTDSIEQGGISVSGSTYSGDVVYIEFDWTKTAGYLQLTVTGTTTGTYSESRTAYWSGTYSLSIRPKHNETITIKLAGTSTTTEGYLSYVSVKKVTASDPVMAINHADDTGAFEIRSGKASSNNFFLGLNAGQHTYGPWTTAADADGGQGNLFIGANAGKYNGMGYDNVFIGSGGSIT